MLDKAKQLLKEAGHPNRIDLTFDVRNKETYVTSAQVIQATCAQATTFTKRWMESIPRVLL